MESIELNTNLVPLFSGTYETQWDIQEYDDDGNELEIDYDSKDFMKGIINVYRENEKNILRDMNVSFIKKVTFTGSYYSPREYNFSTDTIDFTLEVDQQEMYKALDALDGNEDFSKYLSDNFTSYDGFWSHTPNTYQGIYHAIHDDEDGYYQAIGAFISFLMPKETCNDIEEMVWEDWNGNGYGGTNYTIGDPYSGIYFTISHKDHELTPRFPKKDGYIVMELIRIHPYHEKRGFYRIPIADIKEFNDGKAIVLHNAQLSDLGL